MLFLKKRNKVKMVIQLKFSHYPHTSTSEPHYPTFLTKNKKERLPTHGSYKKKIQKKLPMVPKKKILTSHKIKKHLKLKNTVQLLTSHKIISLQMLNTHYSPRFFLWLENILIPNYNLYKLLTFILKKRRASEHLKASINYCSFNRTII